MHLLVVWYLYAVWYPQRKREEEEKPTIDLSVFIESIETLHAYTWVYSGIVTYSYYLLVLRYYILWCSHFKSWFVVIQTLPSNNERAKKSNNSQTIWIDLERCIHTTTYGRFVVWPDE